MVGLGETFEEVVELMHDLRAVSCDIMTIGQYLQPHARRLPVERYVTPEEFAKWREIGCHWDFITSSRALSRAPPITRANKPRNESNNFQTAWRTGSARVHRRTRAGDSGK